MRAFLFCVCLLSVLSGAGQTDLVPSLDTSHEGKFYVYWGYNRSAYNPSDIHFEGEGYDFTLEDVRAHDLPEQFDTKVYFNPTKLTIPQFNLRLGYYISDQFSISLGYEHLKYKIDETQRVKIDGKISNQLSETYGGVYNQEYLTITPDFLSFEHTNGLNYVRAMAEWHRQIWRSPNSKHSAWFNAGVGTGPVICWTDFTLFGERHKNYLHFSGLGMSAQLSARFEFFRHFFVQYNSQLGKTWLWDIILEEEEAARASQNITFTERSLVVGGLFHIGK
jgi:hypothetical protein